jgi:hypothetical protein
LTPASQSDQHIPACSAWNSPYSPKTFHVALMNPKVPLDDMTAMLQFVLRKSGDVNILVVLGR